MYFYIPKRNSYIHRVIGTHPSDLIGYYPLNDLSGSVAHDYSGNDYHGTYYSASVGGETGIGDGLKAPYFDEINDYVDLPSGFLSAWDGREVTVAFWARMDRSVDWDDGQSKRPWMCEDSVGGGFRFESMPNYPKMQYNLNAYAYIRITVGTPTTWQHYAMTCSDSGSIARAYWNGVAGGTTAYGSTDAALTYANIGTFQDGTGAFWRGGIAHVAIWNRVLTASEIAQLAVPA